MQDKFPPSQANGCPLGREILKPSGADRRPPVIVQIEPARIIHAQPQEFRRLVQLLTGKQSPTAAAADDSPSALPCSHLLIDINVAYEGDDEEQESRYCE
ncbi:hypothetical protein KSP39_PZI009068 [Platanthera zijinensis]|uniref:VQ domain-containing protein n=1 Tax=Platanthera zijinensis TaxID=2320716 RepID=A0AAP0BJZ0_9ASPA